MKKCTPCQKNAVLSVGETICNNIRKRDGKFDCYGLSKQVEDGKMSVEKYISTLESKANPFEKQHLDELKKILE